jgi:hypothetical protein
MRFVEDDSVVQTLANVAGVNPFWHNLPVPLESMHRALLRNQDIVPSETLDLLPERRFQSAIGYQYLYVME